MNDCVAQASVRSQAEPATPAWMAVFSLAMGVFGAGTVGAALNMFVAPALIATFGWQMVPRVYAIALLVVAGRTWHWPVMAVLFVTQSLALTYSYGVPLPYGFAGGLVVVLPARLSWTLLTRRGTETLHLSQAAHLRYHAATLASAPTPARARVAIAGSTAPGTAARTGTR